jgi:hypothetical protein
MKNKIYHAIGSFFQKVSRWFFHRTLMACWHCGALVGMNSTYTRGHMWCEPCLQRYVMPELHAAQQSRALDAAKVCRVINHFYVEGVCSQCGSKELPRQ